MTATHGSAPPASSFPPVDVDAWRRNIRETTFSEYHYHMGLALKAESAAAAVEAFGQALREKPDFAGAAFHLAALLRDQGRAVEASEIERTLSAQDPDYPASAHADFGRMAMNAGRYDEAAAEFESACAIRPEQAVFRSELVEAHFKRGTCIPEPRYDDGILSLRRVLELQPDHLDALKTLGIQLLARLDFTGAGACFAHALERDPTDATQHAGRAMAFLGNGMVVEAMDALAQSLDRFPQAPLLLCHLGTARMNAGDVAGAAAAYGEAVAMLPDDPGIKSYLGLALQEQGRAAEALASHAAAIKASPSSGLWYLHSASARHRLGDETAAMADLAMLLRLNPIWGPCWAHLYRWDGGWALDHLTGLTASST